MDNHSAASEGVTALSNDLVVLSARLVREVRRHSDIPVASTRMLSLLDEIGPSPLGALAEADRISQPSMSAHVNELVAKGWVRRDPHPDDARSSLVSMTDEGRTQLAAVRRRNAALVAARIEASHHTAEDLATAVSVLSDLLEGKPC